MYQIYGVSAILTLLDVGQFEFREASWRFNLWLFLAIHEFPPENKIGPPWYALLRGVVGSVKYNIPLIELVINMLKLSSNPSNF
jgi:hypothetical protein